MKSEALLDRVKRGHKLTAAEIAWVRRALANEDPAEDPYTLIHVLWKAGDTDSKELLVRALSYGVGVPDDDGMVRRIALQALASLSPDADLFRTALRMLEEDSSKYVRMIAAVVVGDVARRSAAWRRIAARVLLRRFEALSATPNEEWESCYEGLLNLADVPVDQRPCPTERLSAAHARKDVVEQARRWACPQSE